jgi:hypothetical protein
MSHIDDLSASMDDLQRAQAQSAQELREAQLALPCLLSGQATFIAMKRAVDEFQSRAPQNHDVLIQVDDIIVTEAQFIKPHTFLFEGLDEDGHRAGIVCHFTQVKARILYRPQRETDRIISRVIQGFATSQV